MVWCFGLLLCRLAFGCLFRLLLVMFWLAMVGFCSVPCFTSLLCGWLDLVCTLL